jgi:rubrerythrin
MSPEEIIRNSCEQIQNSVRYSNLNFSSTETPFSMYFTIRKSLAMIPKSREQQSETDKVSLLHVNDVSDNLIKAAEDESYQLKKMLDASKDQIKLLKTKVEAADVKVSKKDQELHQCKETMNKKDCEIDALK